MQLYTVKDYRNKSGLIDLETNQLIVPYEFDEIIIKGTSILLKLNGKWGLISTDEVHKIVYKLKYLGDYHNDIIEDIEDD